MSSYKVLIKLLTAVLESINYYYQNLVKIGSLTAEIFLIWKNVARTNVAQTNVTLTVGICYKCSQEPTFNILSKLGQYS